MLCVFILHIYSTSNLSIELAATKRHIWNSLGIVFISNSNTKAVLHREQIFGCESWSNEKRIITIWPNKHRVFAVSNDYILFHIITHKMLMTFIWRWMLYNSFKWPMAAAFLVCSCSFFNVFWDDKNMYDPQSKWVQNKSILTLLNNNCRFVCRYSFEYEIVEQKRKFFFCSLTLNYNFENVVGSYWLNVYWK